MLENLGPKERSDENQKGPDEDEAGNLGSLPYPVGIEAVHESSRIENQLPGR